MTIDTINFIDKTTIEVHFSENIPITIETVPDVLKEVESLGLRIDRKYKFRYNDISFFRCTPDGKGGRNLVFKLRDILTASRIVK